MIKIISVKCLLSPTPHWSKVIKQFPMMITLISPSCIPENPLSISKTGPEIYIQMINSFPLSSNIRKSSDLIMNASPVMNRKNSISRSIIWMINKVYGVMVSMLPYQSPSPSIIRYNHLFPIIPESLNLSAYIATIALNPKIKCVIKSISMILSIKSENMITLIISV